MENGTYTHPKARSQNTATLLRLVCTGCANTRADLARLTGLSKMTVSNIVADLLEENLLNEIDRSVPVGSQGRRPITLEISPEAPYIVGVFVGRFECAVVVSTLDARLVDTSTFRTHAGLTGDELLETLYVHYCKLTDHPQRRYLGIGISSIGPVDTRRGILLNPPDFHQVQDVEMKRYFEERTGLPVCFDNNMRAAVLAEKLLGHGKELSNILYLGVTYGVGAGVISGGNLMDSPSGVNGEVGHTSINFDGNPCVCGNRGCLEMYASIPRIVESAAADLREAGRNVPSGYDWPTLVQNARGGDYYSLRAIDRLCEHLSVAVVNLVNLYDSEEVFLGHDIALAEGMVERAVEQEVNRRIFANQIKRVRVRMSAFGTQAPIVGSICLVLNSLFKQELSLDTLIAKADKTGKP